MLHHCSHGGGGGAAAPCSCGMLHGACAGGGGGGGGAFSILFPMSGKQSGGEAGSVSPSSSSVDCTLSLGTPSTRQSEKRSAAAKAIPHGTSCVPSFCWDILSQSSRQASAGVRGAAANSSNLGGDPLLLARRCANCDTTSTPLWRNGPRGPKSLCNACGIRYKKEERRAAASTPSGAEQAMGYGYQRPGQQPWGCYSPATMASRSNSISMSFASAADGEDGRHDEEEHLSWRLNVVPPSQLPIGDRPSVFQYQY